MHPGTLAFVRRALDLKDVPRQGWFRAGVARPESVADHSWGVALLAMVAAQERGLDVGRAVRLALVHDIAEAVTGDLVPGEYGSREEKLAGERAGLDALLVGAPDSVRATFVADFEELESESSPEARLVHELDKFEMGLQAARYRDTGVPQEALTDFVASARRGVQDKALKSALDNLS